MFPHKYRFLALFLCTPFLGFAQQSLGQWEDHLSYRTALSIADDGRHLYCNVGKAIFTYDRSSGELERWSKINRLSDVGVSSLAYAHDQQELIVGYSNGNLDFISDQGTINIPDILRSNVIGNKGINRISIYGDEAWLSCGFGIVIIDIERKEVADTYLIGSNGLNVNVSDVLLSGSSVFAATDQGLLTADLTSNLADFGNWSERTDIPNSNMPFDRVLEFDSRLVVHSLGEPDVTYIEESAGWITIPGTTNTGTKDLYVRGDQLVICNRFYVQIRNTALNNSFNENSYSFNSEAMQLNTGYIDESGLVWLADDRSGLVAFHDDEQEYYFPQGPYNSNVWQLSAEDGQLWVAPGALTGSWNITSNNDAFSGLVEGRWTNYKGDPELSNVRDVIETKVDPLDKSKCYFGSWRAGLIELNSNSREITVFNSDVGNSPITDNLATPGLFFVGGLDFDLEGNLWMTNSGTEKPIKLRMRNGAWVEYGCPGTLPAGTLVGQLEVTEEGQVWAVLPRGAGLFVYDHRNTLDDDSDDQCIRLNTGLGTGGLPIGDVYSIAVDLDGEIWVGTSEGPAVHYSPLAIFSDNPIDFQQILIEQDGNVEILLGNQTITSIAIDGANRKWFGTQGGGVFLMSEDGGEQILHFTTENSPLLSDVISDIAIDPVNGEVYIGTDQGIVSYLGDATSGLLANECYDVYPNPVRPEYRGQITIDGLHIDSEVKITDLSGNIVFQTVSNGGRAVWAGTDFSGNRVSTGVYFALVADRSGESTCVSKILFIN